MASLTVIKGADRGRHFDIDGDALTRRAQRQNNIRLHDTEISRHHAQIVRTKDGFLLRDLQSSNGTFLNGQRVDSYAMKSGDVIRIGQSELLFSATTPAAVPEADLSGKINLSGPDQAADASAIVSAIKHSQGSQFLRYPERAGSQWLENSLRNLGVLYETSQAITRITDTEELLDHIIGLIFKSIQADRACILLKDTDTGKLKPTAVRYQRPMHNDERIIISRTIVDWVLRQDQGVLVLDAARDQRFRASHSVTEMGIREAICVPMQGRHDTLGVIYVDIQSDNRKLLTTPAARQNSPKIT